MKRCAKCKGSFRQKKIEETLQVGGHRFIASLPARVCSSCGETYLEAKTLGRFELRVAVSLAEAGETKGEVFKFIRKAVGLRAADLGDLLGVAPETISRWETGERPVDRGAFALVADMAHEALEGQARTLDMLRSIKTPKRLARTVRLVA
jgi:putative zinc finger/helix-turn-helix YgiT family protein